jgi:hypothetical protein
MPSADPVALVDRFYSEVRFALENAYPRVAMQAQDIIVIANDPAARSFFLKEFRRLNDPDARSLIQDYLADVINDLEGAGERADIKVDFVDRTAMAVSAPIAVAGVVALAGASAAAVAAAPFLLAGGLIGLAVSGTGRTLLRTRAQRSKADARKVKQLRDSLE